MLIPFTLKPKESISETTCVFFGVRGWSLTPNERIHWHPTVNSTQHIQQSRQNVVRPSRDFSWWWKPRTWNPRPGYKSWLCYCHRFPWTGYLFCHWLSPLLWELWVIIVLTSQAAVRMKCMNMHKEPTIDFEFRKCWLSLHPQPSLLWALEVPTHQVTCPKAQTGSLYLQFP